MDEISTGVADASGGRADDGDAQNLVFAVCHELGNLVAAIRLQAHLLDEDLPPKQLAVTSVEIDDLSARTSAMLALIRPLLGASRSRAVSVKPAAICAAIQQMFEGHGGRGMRLEVFCEDGLPDVEVDPEVMHHLLLTLAFGAVEAARHRGWVRVAALDDAEGLAFLVEDDAPEDDQLLDWREHMLRGRPLACAVADFILRRRGGRLEVKRDGDVTRIAARLPTAPGSRD